MPSARQTPPKLTHHSDSNGLRRHRQRDHGSPQCHRLSHHGYPQRIYTLQSNIHCEIRTDISNRASRPSSQQSSTASRAARQARGEEEDLLYSTSRSLEIVRAVVFGQREGGRRDLLRRGWTEWSGLVVKLRLSCFREHDVAWHRRILRYPLSIDITTSIAQL